MFNKKSEQLSISFLKENATQKSTTIVTNFEYVNRIFEHDDFIPVISNNVNIKKLTYHCYQSSTFDDIFERHANDQTSHTISLSKKAKFDIYLSPELAKFTSTIIIQSKVAKIKHNNLKLSATAIDNIKMMHFTTVTAQDLFGLILFHTEIQTDNKITENNNIFVPFSIDKLKYNAQYKIMNNNKVEVYLS